MIMDQRNARCFNTLCNYYHFAVPDEQQAHEAHQALCEELQSWRLVCSLSNEQVGSGYFLNNLFLIIFLDINK